MDQHKDDQPNGIPPRKRVLVVDNDRGIRELLRAIFDAENISAEYADSPQTAVSYLGKTLLVLSDVQMSGGGIEALAEKMRAEKEAGNDPGPLVAMTANIPLAESLRNGDIRLAYQLEYVLTKPFEYDGLLTTMDDVLRNKQSSENTSAAPEAPLPDSPPPDA